MTVQRVNNCCKYNPISAISVFVKDSQLMVKVMAVALGIFIATIVYAEKLYNPLFLAKFSPMQAALAMGTGYFTLAAIIAGVIFIYFQNNPPR